MPADTAKCTDRRAGMSTRLVHHKPAPRADGCLSLLLGVQALTLFVVLPLGAQHPGSRWLLDVSHIVFAGVCVCVLTRHRGMQALLLTALALLAAGPMLAQRLSTDYGIGSTATHEALASTAFVFNALASMLVTRHVFAPGLVTGHRVQGAVLVYLNVAALFAIAYGIIVDHAPAAFALAASGYAALGPREQNALLNYFSLTTITTLGYGDVVPVHPLARSLANLEGVFGQLFPATLIARLVALHVSHGQDGAAFPPEKL